jgi:hypothetical protein
MASIFQRRLASCQASLWRKSLKQADRPIANRTICANIMTMRRLAAIGMTARSTVVVLSLTAWFLLSNHCALGVIAASSKAAPEAEGCPMHSAPAKKKPVSQTPCCKDVRAVVAKVLNKATPFASCSIGRFDYAAENFRVPARVVFEIGGLDTGPPGCLSFAQLVLQESMRAHAPPVS